MRNLSKKLLSILLAVSMLLNGSPEIILAEGNVCEVVETGIEYTNVSDAISYIENTDDKSGTIRMLDNAVDNFCVSYGSDITLDLNGKVITSNSGAVSAIVRVSGKLTIKDSGTEIHYFKVNDKGLWVWQSSYSGTADYTFDSAYGLRKDGTATNEVPDENSVIAVSGGCITGGIGTYVINTDTRQGGAIEIEPIGEVVIENGNIVGNTADNGGAIYADAKNDGGTVVGGGMLTMKGGNIVGNTADNGGAIYADANYNTSDDTENKYSQISITNAHLSYNVADTDGGAVFLAGAQLIADGCFFNGNSAANNGGAIGEDDGQDKGIKIGLFNTEITNNTAGTNGGGVYFKFNNSNCLAAGTLITMADGSKKTIENVMEGDLVKTFDHESGTISSSKVYLAYKGETEQTPFTLTFDNNTSLSIVGCHDLLEQSALKYVTISESNANDYIGKYFYGEDGNWHELLSVTEETEACDYYSIYTSVYQNCFANGMLSVPDDHDHLLNIYELDENLKADEAQLQEDIATYGLASFERVSDKYGISQEDFEAANIKYLLIAIGKGLTTLDYLESIFEETVDYRNSNAPVTPMLAGVSPMLLGANNVAPSLSDIDIGVLTIGNGTKIRNNTVNSNANNVYLENGDDTTTRIKIYENNLTSIDVGVTLKDGIGAVTTETNSADYHSYFTSDSDDYVVINDNYSGNNAQFVKLIRNLNLIHENSEDVDVNSDSGNGYKEFVVGKASNSVIHINRVTLSDVCRDSETGKYTGILVKNGDDALIEGTDYTISEGSIKVELTREYLNTLAVGNYTVKVYLNVDDAATIDSNYYEGTINVKVKPAESGNTDSGNTYTVVNTSVMGTGNNAVSRTLGLIAMVTVAGAVMLKKKENY